MTFNRRMKRIAQQLPKPTANDREAQVAAFANRLKAELPESMGVFVVTFDHGPGRLAWSSRRIGESDLVRMLNEMIGVFEQRSGSFGEPSWETATQIREKVAQLIDITLELKPGESPPDPAAVIEHYLKGCRGELTPEDQVHACVAMATAAFVELEQLQRTHHLLREKPRGDA